MTTSPVEIDGVPTKAKAEEIARTMRTLYPDWTVEILGQAAPYSVRRTPPGPVLTPPASQPVSAAPGVGSARVDAVQEFLDFIAKYESAGNYNAYYGHAANTTNPEFTSMSIDQVLNWQDGKKFSACGKYQIIRATLAGLKSQIGLTGSELYDKAMQEKLGRLLLERRGLKKFMSGATPKQEFAFAVACEWAALPGVKPPHGSKSVYAGDGVNHAHVTVAAYLAAIDALRA